MSSYSFIPCTSPHIPNEKWYFQTNLECHPCLYSRGSRAPHSWAKPDVIEIAFMNGSDEERQFTFDTALEWIQFSREGLPAKLANRKLPEFKIVEDLSTARIRILFAKRNESVTGLCRREDTEPTMYLHLDPKHPKWNRYTVLHQFGHALGMLFHEAQRHQAYKLKPDSINKFYADTFIMQGRSEADAHEYAKDAVINLYRYSLTQFNYDVKQDPHSIMRFPLLEEWVENTDALEDYPIPFTPTKDPVNTLSTVDHLWILKFQGR